MRRALRLALVALAVVSATVPVALAGAEPATGGESTVPGAGAAPSLDGGPSDEAGLRAGRTTFGDAVRAASAVAREAVAEVRTPPPSLIVRVRRGSTAQLRDAPAGAVALSAGDTTEFGAPTVFGVVRRQGPWLGVSTPALPNGKLAWIHLESPAVRVSRTAWAIHADVSSRRVVLRRAGKVVRRLSVAVGRPGSPTPTGRFSVTDRIAGDRFGPYYGCCILAISATQPNTPPGWTGGNRMAIHGTDVPSSIGAAASAGCLRAADGDLRVLMDTVPLGTPVIIRR